MMVRWRWEWFEVEAVVGIAGAGSDRGEWHAASVVGACRRACRSRGGGCTCTDGGSGCRGHQSRRRATVVMERVLRRLSVGVRKRPWRMRWRRLLRLFLLSCHEGLSICSMNSHVAVQIAGLGEPGIKGMY